MGVEAQVIAAAATSLAVAGGEQSTDTTEQVQTPVTTVSDDSYVDDSSDDSYTDDTEDDESEGS